mmetsp:Transcript_54198/g.118773  ORF Transcript_54198/g.118773 Transcript_54198/m.118773 type:complete len:653 (+) Transcript_54198:3-1961(+)
MPTGAMGRRLSPRPGQPQQAGPPPRPFRHPSYTGNPMNSMGAAPTDKVMMRRNPDRPGPPSLTGSSRNVTQTPKQKPAASPKASLATTSDSVETMTVVSEDARSLRSGTQSSVNQDKERDLQAQWSASVQPSLEKIRLDFAGSRSDSRGLEGSPSSRVPSVSDARSELEEATREQVMCLEAVKHGPEAKSERKIELLKRAADAQRRVDAALQNRRESLQIAISRRRDELDTAYHQEARRAQPPGAQRQLFDYASQIDQARNTNDALWDRLRHEVTVGARMTKQLEQLKKRAQAVAERTESGKTVDDLVQERSSLKAEYDTLQAAVKKPSLITAQLQEVRLGTEVRIKECHWRKEQYAIDSRAAEQRRVEKTKRVQQLKAELAELQAGSSPASAPEKPVTQQWVSELRRQLSSQSDMVSKLAAQVDATVGVPLPTVKTAVAELYPTVPPFSTTKFGSNLTVLEGGRVLKRGKGCRQSVGLGSAALTKGPDGYFFSVKVTGTAAGWVGGLGIGLTQTSEDSLRRVPDKAWRLPNTVIVGYWGRMFALGKEHHGQWKSESLQVGDVVGLLLHNQGDLLVFVNDEVKMWVPWRGGSGEKYFPLVDVFGCTDGIELIEQGRPPSQPWTPPGSPVEGSPVDSPRSTTPSTMSFMASGA